MPSTPPPQSDVSARRVRPVRVVGGLLVAALGALAVAGLYVVAVSGSTGRALDQSLRELVSDAGSGADGRAAALLDLVSPLSVAAVLAVLVAVAAVRGRIARGITVVAVVLVAQVITQAMKALLPGAGGAGNSLPSGHVTVVTSLVAAALLVLPGLLRPLVALGGAAVVAVIGGSTIVVGWHRPSDVVAAVAVVLGVAGVVLAMEELLRRTPVGPAQAGPAPFGAAPLDRGPLSPEPSRPRAGSLRPVAPGFARTPAATVPMGAPRGRTTAPARSAPAFR